MASTWSVFLAALITALATGLGALPFLFRRDFSKVWLSIANGVAAGIMLGASHNLIAEGARIDPARVLLGLFIGLVAWQFFMGSVLIGVSSLVGHANLVKKVNFPRDFIRWTNFWQFYTLILTPMVFAHVDVAHRKLRIALLLSWGLSGHSILNTYIGPYFRWP